MPKQTIIAFHREGFRLGLNVFPRRDEMLIGFPIVRHDMVNERTLDGLPELFAGHDASGPSDSMEEAFPKSINSNPDPTIVFLCPT